MLISIKHHHDKSKKIKSVKIKISVYKFGGLTILEDVMKQSDTSFRFKRRQKPLHERRRIKD